MTDRTWKTKDGKTIKISEMTDEHLKNTIAFVERRAEIPMIIGDVGTCVDDRWAYKYSKKEIKDMYNYKDLVAERDRRELKNEIIKGGVLNA